MTDTKASKMISGAAYVAYQADLASREGAVGARMAHLFFQCCVIEGARTIEGWDKLVVDAYEGEASIAEAIEYGEAEAEFEEV